MLPVRHRRSVAKARRADKPWQGRSAVSIVCGQDMRAAACRKSFQPGIAVCQKPPLSGGSGGGGAVLRSVLGHRPQSLPPLPLLEPEQVQPRKALVQKEQTSLDAIGQDRGDVRRYVPEIFRIKGLKRALEPEHVAKGSEIQVLAACPGKDVLKPGHERAFRVQEFIVCQAVGVGELGENFTLVLVHGNLNDVQSTRERGCSGPGAQRVPGRKNAVSGFMYAGVLSAGDRGPCPPCSGHLGHGACLPDGAGVFFAARSRLARALAHGAFCSGRRGRRPGRNAFGP